MVTPLTQEYFDSKLEKLASKEDLNGLATKGDLNDLTATVDDLAASVAKGFNEVYERMDAGFNAVNERIDRLESEMRQLRSDIDRRFAEVNERLDALHSSVGNLGEAHRQVERELTTLRVAYQDLKGRVDRMEQQLLLKPV